MNWGAISEIYVPYRDGKAEFSLVRDMVGFLNEKGVRGYFVNGVGAEALPLSKEERMRMFEKVAEEAKGRILIQNITEYSLDRTLELARHAKNTGATHVLISQLPVYSLRDPMRFYLEVSEKSELPVILYNEKLLGSVFSPTQVAAILNMKGFVGYKDSTRDISHLQEVVSLKPKEKDIIAGSDSMIYVTYLLGGSGIVSLVINPFPELIVKIVEELEGKNYQKALELQMKINEVREVLKSYGFSEGYREACRLRGVDCGDPFLTTEKLNRAQIEELSQKLRLLNLI